jgi:NADH-quinone oxidoreductase subunit C
VSHDATLAKLREKLGADGFKTSEFRDNFRLIVEASKVFDTLKFLKEQCGFDMLIDVTCVDYLQYPDASDRYGVIYCLLNTVSGERLVVKTFVNDPDPTVPSAYPLWKGADWMEREVYDMYGVAFGGHPDLRRILMPHGFASYPLRKDYPLRGRLERHNFPAIPRAEG